MRTLFTLIIALTTTVTFAQEVARAIIVEHFTNTYCSACASRNPGFYANLDNQPDVLHVAYHPSSPYSDCPLSQHNVSENDARPMYYNVFGGTPRIVVQGEVVPGGDSYSNPVIFDPYENQTTAFDMTASVSQNATLDSVIVAVTITKTANSSIDSLNIHTVLVEETLNFNANNGENVHHDVFRKSLNEEYPVKIRLPVNVGTDTTITYVAEISSEWNGSEVKAVTLLQNDQRQIEQAAESAKLNFIASLTEELSNSIRIYPNPTRIGNSLTVSTANGSIQEVMIFNVQGRKVGTQEYKDQQNIEVNTENLTSGIYTLSIITSGGVVTKKVSIN
jgi:hypothetical protein